MRTTLAPTAWREREGTPVGLAVAGGAATLVGAALAASLVPAADPLWRLGFIALALAAFAARTEQPIALVPLVPLAWLVVNGFLVDRYGVLFWHGMSDVYRFIALAVAAGLGVRLGRRRLEERRRG
jgi:hypothetical protein